MLRVGKMLGVGQNMKGGQKYEGWAKISRVGKNMKGGQKYQGWAKI